MAYQGVDVRQTGDRLLFRAFLQNSSGAVLATGTTTISIVELQNDGTVKSYDFNDNTFKTTALTTATLALTHRPSNNATTNTGFWTVALTTLTGFTAGNLYQVITNNSGASPTDQIREFQFGVSSAFDPFDNVRGGMSSLPNAAANAANGLPISIAGGLDLDAKLANTNEVTAVRMGALTDWLNGGRLDLLLDAVKAKTDGLNFFGSNIAADVKAIDGDTDLPSDLATQTNQTTLLNRLTVARAGYLDNLNVSGLVASSVEVSAIQNNTRVVRSVPVQIQNVDSGTLTYRIDLTLYDDAGNMEAPDSAPTITLVNQSGTDRSSRLDSATMTLVSTGHYRAIYTDTAGDALEQLNWLFSVTENAATRVYANQSQIVDTIAVDYTSTDRTRDDAIKVAVDAGLVDTSTTIPGLIATAQADLDTITGNDGVTLATAQGNYAPLLAVSAPPNWSTMVISGAGAVDSLVQGYLNTLIIEATAGRIAGNHTVFYANADTATTKTLDNVGGGAGSDPATIADAVWDEILAGHAGVGSTGAALAAAGGSGDPWATALPGAYVDGTAGFAIGTYIDAKISAVLAKLINEAVTNQNPTPTGELNLVRGDSYDDVANDALTFNAGVNVDTATSIILSIKGQDGTVLATVTGTGAGEIVTIKPDADDTDLPITKKAGATTIADQSHIFDVEVKWAGTPNPTKTIKLGPCSVVEDVTL